MKLHDIFIKSLKEQLRSYWILILTVSMAPFFVVVYYLINESSKPNYKILYFNNDRGILTDSSSLNHGQLILNMAGQILTVMENLPVTIKPAVNYEKSLDLIKNKKADVLAIIPADFSECIEKSIRERKPVAPEIEFMGDITDYKYILAAIWGNELIRSYIEHATGIPAAYVFKETPIGRSGKFSDFELFIPGMLILSIIMLMFSASIAIVIEIENKTITRFRLSGVKTIELLTGISGVQIIIGLISLALTLGVAYMLGFHPGGSFYLIFLIVILTSLSIIAFSFILAAATRSANEILIIGNFPLFLFMFFTGAAFPIEGEAIFSIGNYPFTIQGLMSATHSVSAMKKVTIMDMGFVDIIPELTWLLLLTLFYFAAGTILFNKRHMKLTG